MKFSLLVLGFLAIVCLSFSEAAEESSDLKQSSKHKVNIHIDRETRNAGKKAKKVGKTNKKKAGRKSGKKGGRKSGKKGGRKSGKNGGKKSGKEGGRKSGKKGGRKSGKKGGMKSGKKGGRKSGKKVNEGAKKWESQTEGKRKSIKTVTGDKSSKPSGRANLVGSHCEFVDLCVIERMSESGCNMGDKFVIKSPKGTRRQFLMVDGSKIIAFLKNGKKITDCGGNLTDVTNKVTCKAVAGAGTLKLQRQNETATNETTTIAAPASEEAATTDEAPNTDEAAPTDELPPTDEAPTTEEGPTTDVMPPLQAGQFHCPCPQRTCFTTITSTNNKHKIECGSKTFNVPCGGPLKGSKLGLLISIIDVFEQPLCSTNTYVTLIKDLVWKCSDLNIPEDESCDATTAAPETTGPDSSDPSMGAITTGDTNDTVHPITNPSNDTVPTIASSDPVPTMASNDTITTIASNDTITTIASNDTITTIASNDTVTTIASNDTVTTIASNDTVTTVASNVTTT